jgi:hypothetical protein
MMCNLVPRQAGAEGQSLVAGRRRVCTLGVTSATADPMWDRVAVLEQWYHDLCQISPGWPHRLS